MSEEPPITRRTLLTFLGGTLTGGSLMALRPTADSAPIPAPTNTSTPSPSPTPATVSLTENPLMGSPEAPVTLVYYGDFQCPFSKRFEGGTLPSIESKYIYGAEDVKLVYKPIRSYGDDSLNAAISSHCVWNQTDGNQYTYWAWHEALLEHDDGLNSGWASVDSLVQLAEDFEGIDGEELRAGMNTRARELHVYDDEQEGHENGLRATPFFLVFRDDPSEVRKIYGAQPIDRFETVIDSFL